MALFYDFRYEGEAFALSLRGDEPMDWRARIAARDETPTIVEADGDELEYALLIVSNGQFTTEFMRNRASFIFVGDEARKIILNWGSVDN